MLHPKKNGEGVLVIADGWNDLDRSKRPVQESFIYKLLLGDVLSSASVLVTSRPTASARLHRDDVFDRYIEICGFDEESMEGFIRSQFSSDQLKADTIFHQMNYNPLLRHMCTFPVTCKYLCRLRHTYDNHRDLPCSMSELCTKVIMNVLCSCQKSNTPVSISTLPEIESLPSILRESWWDICKIAFQSYENKPLDIRSYQDGIMMLGLVEYGASEDNLKVLVNFPHPTSQEYLAALHVMNQPPDNQLQVLRTIISKQESNPLFWRLYLGLSISSDQWSHPVFCQALQMASAFNLILPKCLLCRCASIAQSDAITSEVINYLSTQVETNTIVQLDDAHNSVDCDAMLYVIDNIKDSKCDGLHINFSECGFNSKQIRKLATILTSNPAKLRVEELDLSGNSLPDKYVAHLFKTAAASFQSLENLFVRNNKIRDEGITAIMEALAKSPSQSLRQFDVSFNVLKLSGLRCLHSAVKSGILANLKALFMKGCLMSSAEKNTRFLKTFSERLLSRCPHLRQLNMCCNAFVTSYVTEIMMQLSDNKIHLTLDGKTFTDIMEDSMQNKRMINHTVVHGVFVGSGRSGKNSLMNRLIGEGPSDPNELIPSTGLLENVIKVQVKKLCRVAASEEKCLQWKKLKYEHEDLELMMATIRSHKTNTKEPDSVDPNKNDTVVSRKVVPSAKIVGEYLTQLEDMGTLSGASTVETTDSKAHEDLKVAKGCVVYEGQGETTVSIPLNSHMHSEDPLEMVKRAAELHRMDALHDHFESSWMLYLTNTGGQTEFQEILPVLVCGPSVFFITFPLNQNLNNHYTVRYDGCHESYTYQSSATLMEEILQTLSTIEAFNLDRSSSCVGTVKVFFVGTHKDKLRAEPECSVNDQINCIDKRLRDKVEKTSLYRQRSIVYICCQY